MPLVRDESEMKKDVEKIPGVMPSGTTIFYTMIGTPVVQVKSPSFYNAYFAANGIDAVMIAMDVPTEEVRRHFEHLRHIGNFGGAIVTVPHKQAAAGCMDELTKRAEDLTAVNVVCVEEGRLVGDMVDGLGFLVAVRAHGLSLAGSRVAIVGGGGAGSAIAHAIAGCGAGEIAIREPRTERHGFLGRLLERVHPEARVSFDLTTLAGFDLVVNASPVGMNEDSQLPFPTDTLSPPTLVADVVTNPKVTPWLAAARDKGCEVLYGAEMAYGQFGWMGRHLGLDIADPEDTQVILS